MVFPASPPSKEELAVQGSADTVALPRTQLLIGFSCWSEFNIKLLLHIIVFVAVGMADLSIYFSGRFLMWWAPSITFSVSCFGVTYLTRPYSHCWDQFLNSQSVKRHNKQEKIWTELEKLDT